MALTQDAVLAGIKEIVVEVAGIDASKIAMDKKFTDEDRKSTRLNSSHT